MNYELIKAAVAAVIKENGNEEITGNLLQQVLHSIINILGVGYQYMGMATPTTAPGTPDARQFYFAVQEGAYSNFTTSPITELDGRELAIFYYDTAWHVVMTGVATRDAMGGYAFYGESLASGSVITGVDENTFFLVGPGTYTINEYSATISTPGISALMYDVSNDELIDYILFPYDTAPTAGSTKPVTSGGVKTALDGKIDKVPDALTGEIPVFDGDGGLEGSNKFLSDYATQDDLDAVEQEVALLAGEAGLAEAVIDTDGAGAEQEFTFRKSGGDGGAYYRKIKGKTIAWNQLFNKSTITHTNGTAWANSYNVRAARTNGAAVDYIDVVIGHTYAVFSTLFIRRIQGVNTTAQSVDDYFLNSGSDQPNAVIFTTTTGNDKISLSLQTGQGDNGVAMSDSVFNAAGINLVDLTVLGLGSLTVQQLYGLISSLDYPYNTGKLKNNDAEAVETTGRNQYNPATGKAQVIGGQTYYIGGTYTSLSQDGVAITPAGDGTFTPASTGEVVVVGGNATDTIINISDADNGLWQPYWKRTLNLGLNALACHDENDNAVVVNGLDGVGSSYDEGVVENRMLTKIIKRRGRYTFTGEESWTKATGLNDPTKEGFYIDLDFLSPTRKNSGITDKYANEYASGTYSNPSVIIDNIPDKSFGLANGNATYPFGNRMVVRDSACATADAMAAAIAGVGFDYELATPVTLTLAEPLNLGVKVDENGTERAVAPEGATAPSAPFVADTTYTMSVARMVEKLNSI